MKDIRQYRKTCGTWESEKLTAPDGWKFDRCGSVNLSIVRVKNTGGIGWNGFEMQITDLKDVNIFVKQDNGWNVVTRGPGMKTTIVNRPTRYEAGMELVCQAKAFNEMNKGKNATRPKNDVFNEFMYLCRFKYGGLPATRI